MALKATIYKAEIQVADMDRGHYADYALTLARHRHARGQVAAQRDDVADAVRLVLLEDRRDLGLRRGDAG